MQGEKGWAANNGGMDGGGRRRCFDMTDWDSGDHLRPVDERERVSAKMRKREKGE